MVPDPDIYDDDEFLRALSREDESDFRDLYSEKFSNIDLDRIRTELKNQISQIEREFIESAQSIVGGFHPRRRSAQGASGFEFEFFSPLCEVDVDGGDLLMARADYNSLHLCIVACEVGGENQYEWVRRINTISDNLAAEGMLDRIQQQLGCSSHTVNRIQYITLAREVDLLEFEYSDIGHLVEPDNYSVWERNRENQEFRYRGGSLAHQDLTDAIYQGFDYGSIGAPTIQYMVGTHPVLVLEEVVYTLLTDHINQEDDHPQEFDRDEFRDRYESPLQLGAQGDDYDEVVNREVDRLLSFGSKINLIEDDPDEIDSSKDYDLKFTGEKPHLAKKAVLNKFLDHRSPIERGSRAFSRAKDAFEPQSTDLNQF
ncbi:hypothetical protein PM022_18955 [Halorubrum ezzemoulense]|uniref:hypothetical protein n=1 Tax=Halorubrum ezzemoulense TaxID=337243 RepID=UPI00232C8B57|nr:hypothetical protein [Halorubrum ezzemoulense]MDB2276558.1 hypothetical protein [Halorubrum ezzemoulense]